MTHESNIALLIDADNCPAAKIEGMIDELAKYGVINIRRAYGNWNNGDTRLMNLLRNGIEAAAADDGWANLGAVGSHISKQASFDSRNLGYAKLSGLIQAIDLFEFKRNEKGSFVRDRKFGKKATQ